MKKLIALTFIFTFLLGCSKSYYSINIDGKDVLFVESELIAKEVIEELKKYYTPKPESSDDIINIIEIQIPEIISFNSSNKKPDQVYSKDDAIEFLLAGSLQRCSHTVKEGDNLYSIAKSYNVDFLTLLETNFLNLNSDTISLINGDILTINIPVPYLHIIIKYHSEYNESIPQPKKLIYDSNLLKTQLMIVDSGSPGINRIISDFETINGVISKETRLDTKVVSEPTIQTVKFGTR